MLSDPDVISNHGLAQSGNAALAVAMIERLRSGSGSVVFDETIHGFARREPPNPLLLLFRFPFVMATIQGVIAIALLLVGDGRPLRHAAAGAAQRSAPGGRGCLRTSPSSSNSPVISDVMVKRYVLETLRDVGRQLHAPRGLSTAALIAWLQRVGTGARRRQSTAAR